MKFRLLSPLTPSNLGVLGLLGLLIPASGSGCQSELSLQIELLAPRAPDPFGEVQTVRVRVRDSGLLVTVGEVRWDQGPMKLPVLAKPSFDRVVVEGLSLGGEVLASGVSPVLDLVRAPPETPVEIYFSRVGALSVLDSMTYEPRVGAKAVTLPLGQVLLVGGRDANGCVLETTVMLHADLPRVRPGPLIPGGRVGEFHAPLLPDGRVLILGGELRTGVGCDETKTADSLAVLDPQRGTVRTAFSPLALARPGATAAAVSDNLVLLAGGQVNGVPSSVVHQVHAETLDVQTLGQLDGPRSGLSSAVVSGGRLVLLGGRESDDLFGVRDDAVVFVPARGSVLEENIKLCSGECAQTSTRARGLALLRPAVARTRSGTIMIAGGQGPAGEGQSRVDALVVRSERDIPLGDFSPVTTLSSTVGDADLVALDDGSLLALPREPRPDISWVRLLPRSTREIARPAGFGGALRGGKLKDGTAIFLSERGRLLSFNPGPGAVFGLLVTNGTLGLPLAPGLGLSGLGIAPRRPERWRFTELGLEGRRDGPGTGQSPDEFAVITQEPVFNFEIEFDMSLQDRGRAALMFGLVGSEFDYVLFQETTTLERERSLPGLPIDCRSIETPEFLATERQRIRVSRNGDTVALDLGADDLIELVCTTPDPLQGHLALGVVRGVSSFDRIRITDP